MGDTKEPGQGGGPLRLVPASDSSDQTESGGAAGGGAAGGGAASGGAASGGAAAPSVRGASAGGLSQKEIDDLVVTHQGLVPAALARLGIEGFARERDDLLAFGLQGLVEAARRYDPAQGPFRRFAYYRVRGAMIDGMRSMGPWTRRGYERARMARALDSAVESASDGQTEPSRLAAEEASERLRQHMASMVTAMTLGVFAERAFEGEEIVSKDPGRTAEELLGERELRAAVREALDELPEPDQQIVRRHYLGGERLDLIAEELGFSKSWASRIHSRALKRLGTVLRAHAR